MLSISDINAVPLDTAARALPTSRATTSRSTTGLPFSASRKSFSYPFTSPPNNFPSFCSFVFVIILEAMAGTTVRAIRRLASSEYAIVSPMSTKSCLVMPSVNTIGAKTQIVVSVEAIIAPATSLAPSIAAARILLPSPRNLYIFSITTMELSTSIPIPSASPEREIIFKVTPLKYMHTIAVTRLMGMEKATTSVGRKSFKNKIRIKIASRAPNTTLLTMVSITRSM